MTDDDIKRTYRIKGALYGKACADAWGTGLEFRSAPEIQALCPTGIPAVYADITHRNPKYGVFQPGQWSDDTAQALCIINAWVRAGATGAENLVRVFAQELVDWLIGDGSGCGGHTMLVLNDPEFLGDPVATSRRHWEISKGNAAANGAVMRAAAVGILPCPADQVPGLAALFALATHYDPRCVASAVAVAIATRTLVDGGSPEAAAAAASAAVDSIDPATVIGYMGCADLADLKLDERSPAGRPLFGYTYKTLGAGFWALRNHHLGWEEAVRQVLQAGGDTDTNAAVAGALLGAALGFDAIPRALSSKLRDRAVLQRTMTWLVNGYRPEG